MIYVLHGEDTFSSREFLRELYGEVGPPEVWDSNITEIEAKGFDFERFQSAAQSMPFLGKRRIVVVKGLLGASEPQGFGTRRRATTKVKSGREGAPNLLEYLFQVPTTTDIVFFEGRRLSSTNKLLKDISPEAELREFRPLQREDLAKWIRSWMKNKGGNITGGALDDLIGFVGSDLAAMDNELEKLTTYCDGRPITPADVQTLVSQSRQVNIFALVDALMEGRMSRALKLLEDIVENEERSASYIIGMIGRQARLISIAHSLLERKVPRNEWNGKLGVNQEFVIRKIGEQARRFSSQQITDLYHLLIQTDLSIKTGVVADEHGLLNLLTRAATSEGSLES